MSAADEQRYIALADDADHLRREAMKLDVLSATERQKLKDLGTLQATVEAGIGVAHAYGAVGRTADATAALGKTASALDEVDRTLESLRQEGAQRLGQQQRDASDTLRPTSIVLALVVLAALVAGILSSITTSRAVTRPLGALTRDMHAIGRGDLRRSDLSRDTLGAAEYETLAEAFDQARERLRGLLAEMQRQSDEVAAAASELASAAGGASDSTQHVATAVTEMAHGAGSSSTCSTGRGARWSSWPRRGARSTRPLRESQERGREIRASATGTAQEIGKAVDTLLAAREVFDRSAKEIAACASRSAWSTTSRRRSPRSRRRPTCWR